MDKYVIYNEHEILSGDLDGKPDRRYVLNIGDLATGIAVLIEGRENLSALCNALNRVLDGDEP